MPERARWPLWLRLALPAVVLVAALLVGSGAFSTKPASLAQRAAAIERVVKCPACDDISVAQSENSTAIAVRHQIVQSVQAGQSASQIESQLVAEYGPSILLEPPDAGGIALIWVIPIVLGAGTVGVVAALFIRRTRQFRALRADSVAS
jgi:cytochrome c-type biogenesis protein CcmH